MPHTAFAAFGRARSGAPGLRARSSGVPTLPGAAPLTPRRPRTPPPPPPPPTPRAARLPPHAVAPPRAPRAGRRSGPAASASAADDAWHAAAARGDVLALVGLVRAGFEDVDARAPRGARAAAIHCAAALAREDVVACVFELARGVGGAHEHFGHRDEYAAAVVRATDGRGRTALHYAATADEGEIAAKYIAATVQRLVLYGVPPSSADNDGLTPLRLAQALGHDAAAAALLRATRGAGG